MFVKEMYDKKLSPSFINSILTNPSLYDMLKNNFDENIEYFQNIEKDIYLEEILKEIEDLLSPLTILNEDKLNKIKIFYDDFVINKIKEDNTNIFKTKLFRNINLVRDIYKDLYEYIMKSIDYENIINEYITPLKEKLHRKEKLNLQEFNLILDYVKTNIEGYIDIELVTDLLRAHIYKQNHIFDKDVVYEMLKSTSKEYLKDYNIVPSIILNDEVYDLSKENTFDIDENTIILKSIYVDTFISGNYVELFNELFYRLSLIEIKLCISKNKINYKTIKILLNMINHKVDLTKIYKDKSYNPIIYINDLKASAFLKTLLFYQRIGANLIPNYIKSKIKKITPDLEHKSISLKEHSLVIEVDYKFLKMDKTKFKELYDSYKVISLLYNEDATKKKTIDLIKDEKNFDTIKEYYINQIMDVNTMIEDATDFIEYSTDNKKIKRFINNLFTIYVDTFYYSLNSNIVIKLSKSNFDVLEFLNDLEIKINAINENDLTKDFIKEAINTINLVKQNYSETT